MTTNCPKPRITFIDDLCKQRPEDQIREAEATFWAYLEIVIRIAEHERLRGASDVTHPPGSTYSDSESLIQSVKD